jgi:hypothetical protein
MALAALKAFGVDGADVTVWVVKKSGGLKDAPPIFTARWVETDPRLDAALKEVVARVRGGIEEVRDYGLLSQNNEASALSIGLNETHAPLVIARCSDPTPDRRATRPNDLINSDFYLVKLVAGGQTLLAFRKTDRSWKSKSARGIFNAIYADEILTLDDNPRFSLSNFVDLFVIGAEIFVLDKAAFESLLNYKQAHVEDFAALQREPAFAALFTQTDELTAFVGANKIQLRRASAIKAKGYYKDPEFMKRLRAEAAALHLNIEFDDTGKILPTAESCRDIFQALLDHRLDSRLSTNIYDVEDAAKI